MDPCGVQQCPDLWVPRLILPQEVLEEMKEQLSADGLVIGAKGPGIVSHHINPRTRY